MVIIQKTQVLLIIMLLLATIFFVIPSIDNSSVSAVWWNSSWAYMKVIQITNPSASYQMKVWVNKTTGNINCSGHCNNNFSDIRFTSSTNTSLDFYMQNNSVGNWAIFYVETSGSSTMNMYYGNTAAPPASNGTNTFLVFDSFEYASNITGYGWTWEHGPTLPNSYVAHDGSKSIRLQHKKPSTYFHRHYVGAGVFHYFFYDNKTFNGVGQELTSVADTRWDVDVGHNRVTSSTLYTKTKGAVTTTIANVTKQGGAWHEVEFIFKGVGSNISLKLDGVRIFSNWTDNMDELFFYCNELLNTTTAYDWYVDGVWVRKWAYTIPVLGSVSIEHDILDFPVIPSAPVYFEALTHNTTEIKLNWTKGATSVDKTTIIAKIGSYPVLGVDAVIYNGSLSYFNHTGLSHNVHWFYKCYSWNSTSTGCYNTTFLRGHDTTENQTGLVVVDNTVNTTGTNQYAYRPLTGVSGEWWVWVNQTGDLTPLHQFMNLVNAHGTHTYFQNGTGYWDWANITGNATGGGGTANNRVTSYLVIGLFSGVIIGSFVFDFHRKKKRR